MNRRNQFSELIIINLVIPKTRAKRIQNTQHINRFLQEHRVNWSIIRATKRSRTKTRYRSPEGNAQADEL
jgi:hypothetical protein